MAQQTLKDRPWDWVFIVGFVAFTLTSATSDQVAARDAMDGVIGQGLQRYAAIDPLVGQNPTWLRVMSGISAFVFGPFLVVMTYAFVRGLNWIRVPAFCWASAMTYSLAVHMTMEFVGPYPPNNAALVIAIYLPYAVLPIATAWRLRKHRPFEAAADIEHHVRGS